MVYYAIISGDDVGICNDAKTAFKYIQEKTCPIYKTFNTRKDAEDFCTRMTGLKRPISPIDGNRLINRNKIPIKGKTVAYIHCETYKSKSYYSFGYQIPGKEWEFGFGTVEVADLNIATITSEIEAIKDILSKLPEINEMTVYIKDTRLVTLWSKTIQSWIQSNWIVKNPPAEFELIRSLWNQINDRSYTIRLPPKNLVGQLTKLKTVIRDNIN